MTQQTLQQLLVERVSTYAASDRPAELIDAGIDKLFKDVAEDAFRSYGDFGKAIKEAVKQALPANVSDMFELTRYNALVASALKRRWEAAAVSEALLGQVNTAIDEVLDTSYITGEVNLSDLFSAFVEAHKEEAVENRWESPEIRFEDGSTGSTKYLHIYFDKEPEESHRSGHRSPRSDYGLAHALHVRIDGKKETGKTYNPTYDFGSVYSAKLDEKKIGANMQIYGKWEKLLASLYYGNAALVIDCDADDFSYCLYG